MPIGADIPFPARSHGEQLLDRDRRGAWVGVAGNQVGDDVADGGGERQCTVVDRHSDEGAGDAFGDRADFDWIVDPISITEIALPCESVGTDDDDTGDVWHVQGGVVTRGIELSLGKSDIRRIDELPGVGWEPDQFLAPDDGPVG